MSYFGNDRMDNLEFEMRNFLDEGGSIEELLQIAGHVIQEHCDN